MRDRDSKLVAFAEEPREKRRTIRDWFYKRAPVTSKRIKRSARINSAENSYSLREANVGEHDWLRLRSRVNAV